MSRLEDEYRRQLIQAGLPMPDKVNYCLQYADGENPARKMQVDFAWTDIRLAVEIQGGTHMNGAHVEPWGYKADREKSNEAQLRDWMILEFTADHINGKKSGTYALETTRRALQKLGVYCDTA
jgi:hypothetical protein